MIRKKSRPEFQARGKITNVFFLSNDEFSASIKSHNLNKMTFHLTKAREPDIWGTRNTNKKQQPQQYTILNSFAFDDIVHLLPAYAFYMILSATFARAFLLGLEISHPAVIDKNTVPRPLYMYMYVYRWREKKNQNNNKDNIHAARKTRWQWFFRWFLVILIAHVALVIFFVIRKQNTQMKAAENVRQRNRRSCIPNDIL